MQSMYPSMKLRRLLVLVAAALLASGLTPAQAGKTRIVVPDPFESAQNTKAPTAALKKVAQAPADMPAPMRPPGVQVSRTAPTGTADRPEPLSERAAAAAARAARALAEENNEDFVVDEIVATEADAMEAAQGQAPAQAAAQAAAQVPGPGVPAQTTAQSAVPPQSKPQSQPQAQPQAHPVGQVVTPTDKMRKSAAAATSPVVKCMAGC